jgi:hypothetical protein
VCSCHVNRPMPPYPTPVPTSLTLTLTRCPLIPDLSQLRSVPTTVDLPLLADVPACPNPARPLLARGVPPPLLLAGWLAAGETHTAPRADVHGSWLLAAAARKSVAGAVTVLLLVTVLVGC